MGLLDSVLGSVLHAVSSGEGSPDAQGGGLGEVAGLLAQTLGNDGAHGGLAGLVEKFNQAGLGPVIASWIGSGHNLPISAEQLQQVLGPQAGALAGPLAEMLPKIVDHLTPQGQMPAGGVGNSGDVLSTIMGSLLKGG